jgi:hypothetical protein
VDLAAARHGEGRTVFDWIVDIFAEQQVPLELRQSRLSNERFGSQGCLGTSAPTVELADRSSASAADSSGLSHIAELRAFP